VQESLKLLYREVEDEDEDGVAAAAVDAGAETWNEQTYQHVDVIAADHVFTDNTDAVVNTETRSVTVTPGIVYTPRHTLQIILQVIFLVIDAILGVQIDRCCEL